MPLFYSGWWVVFASVLGLMIGPGQFLMSSLGIVMLPLQEEFGWNRAEISFCLTAFTVVLALSMPVVGSLVDHFGSRSVLLPSVVIFAVLLAAISFLVNQLWELWLIFALIGSLAAGANSLPYMRTISAWFDTKRGLAIGIAMSGAGLSYFYASLIVEFMTDNFGWRAAYYALALSALAVVPVLFWLFREPSEHKPALSPVAYWPEPDSSMNRGLTRRQAVCSPLFWLLFAIFCLLSFSLFGMLPHLVPMLLDRGLTSSLAASVAANIGIASLVARAINGYLIDRFFAPRVAFFCFLLSAIGLGMLATGTASYFSLLIVTILLGFSIGAEMDLLAFLVGRYFGLRNFGQIYGILLISLPAGTSIGALAFGGAYEIFGSYVGILTVCAAFNSCIAFAALKLPRFPPQFDRDVPKKLAA